MTRLPARPLPAGANNPASEETPAALPRQTLHQPGVQEAAEKKQLLTRGLSDGGRFRNPMERTTGRRETLRTQNKLHRLQKAFVLGLRTWPFSQRWCNTKEQGLCQRKLFTGYADGKAAKGSRIKTCQSPPGPASPPKKSQRIESLPQGFSISHCSLAPSTTPA